jgi:hypothetical protein
MGSPPAHCSKMRDAILVVWYERYYETDGTKAEVVVGFAYVEGWKPTVAVEAALGTRISFER